MRHLLRQATASSHQALDHALGSLDLTGRAGYARFLRAHAIGVAPLAPAFAAFVERSLGLPPPDYPAMLAADLAALGVDAAALPRLAAPEPLAPAAVTYVLAGSRLGLASIRRAPYWGSLHDTARAYMDDAEGLRVWRGLVAWLDRAEMSESEAATLVTSADAAFALFAQAFALSGAEALRT